MAKYRKKPVVIEAAQWDGTIESCNLIAAIFGFPKDEDGDAILSWISQDGKAVYDFQVAALEGNLNISKDDWIIKGVKGELYPCKPDIFDATYEAV